MIEEWRFSPDDTRLILNEFDVDMREYMVFIYTEVRRSKG